MDSAASTSTSAPGPGGHTVSLLAPRTSALAEGRRLHANLQTIAMIAIIVTFQGRRSV